MKWNEIKNKTQRDLRRYGGRTAPAPLPGSLSRLNEKRAAPAATFVLRERWIGERPKESCGAGEGAERPGVLGAEYGRQRCGLVAAAAPPWQLRSLGTAARSRAEGIRGTFCPGGRRGRPRAAGAQHEAPARRAVGRGTAQRRCARCVRSRAVCGACGVRAARRGGAGRCFLAAVLVPGRRCLETALPRWAAPVRPGLGPRRCCWAGAAGWRGARRGSGAGRAAEPPECGRGPGPEPAGERSGGLCPPLGRVPALSERRSGMEPPCSSPGGRRRAALRTFSSRPPPLVAGFRSIPFVWLWFPVGRWRKYVLRQALRRAAKPCKSRAICILV